MVYSEVRTLDNASISGNLVKVNWLGTGSKVASIIDIQSVSGTPSMTVKVYRVDPGAKGKLGNATSASAPILSHSGIQAAGLSDIYADEATGARFTGLFRTEFVFSGPGSINLTHTLVAKD